MRTGTTPLINAGGEGAPAPQQLSNCVNALNDHLYEEYTVKSFHSPLPDRLHRYSCRCLLMIPHTNYRTSVHICQSLADKSGNSFLCLQRRNLKKERPTLWTSHVGIPFFRFPAIYEFFCVHVLFRTGCRITVFHFSGATFRASVR